MSVPYTAVPVKQPIPSLGGSRVRYRPLLAVTLMGPAGPMIRDGLLDTGSDDTVFSEDLAALLGVDLGAADERWVALAGRPNPIRCRYAPLRVWVTDGQQETYEWNALIGFVAGRLHYNLLGYAGFLQFFQVTFLGDLQEARLLPNSSFPGRRL